MRCRIQKERTLRLKTDSFSLFDVLLIKKVFCGARTFAKLIPSYSDSNEEHGDGDAPGYGIDRIKPRDAVELLVREYEENPGYTHAAYSDDGHHRRVG